MTDLSEKTPEQLRTLIANHERLGKTNDPRYLDALRVLDQKQTGGFDFHKSIELIRAAARRGEFLSYGQLADESGLEWNKVRWAITGHLLDLIAYAHNRGWPLLSAIVVNVGNVKTGKMKPDTLSGFANAARKLGIKVGEDEAGFLDQQQQAVFRWAKEANA